MDLRHPLSIIFPETCVDGYIDHGDYYNVECFKAGLSKLLGYGVVVGSSLVKIPQIIKIAKSKSAAGLSIPSILLELLTFSSSFAYSLAKGFPFSSYGESTFLALQTFLIAWMTIGWEVSQLAGVIFAAVFAAFTAVTLSPATPISMLYTLQTLNVPIVVSAKLLQIFVNWRNGSTGQLSAITVLLFALGSTARIFTSIQETGDSLIIVTFLLSTLCNYILLAQVIYYWRSPLKPTEKYRKQQ